MQRDDGYLPKSTDACQKWNYLPRYKLDVYEDFCQISVWSEKRGINILRVQDLIVQGVPIILALSCDFSD